MCHVEEIDAAIEIGWLASFWVNNEEYGPVCQHCAQKYIQSDPDGEFELKAIFVSSFLDSASSKRYDVPLAQIEKVKALYPDRELIKSIRVKFITHTVDSLTKDETVDMINHQHQLIADLDREIENYKIELQSHYDDF
jgi:hypothetical protein